MFSPYLLRVKRAGRGKCWTPTSGQSWGARAEPQVPDDAVTVAWRAPFASALADCFAYPHFLAVGAPNYARTERLLSARTQ